MSGQGLPISPGTLANSLKRFVPLFEPVADAILAHQNEAALRHADETGWRVQELRGEDRSSRAWLWTSVSSDAVSFHIDPSRSAEAAQKLFSEALLDTVIVLRPLQCLQAARSPSRGAGDPRHAGVSRRRTARRAGGREEQSGRKLRCFEMRF